MDRVDHPQISPQQLNIAWHICFYSLALDWLIIAFAPRWSLISSALSSQLEGTLFILLVLSLVTFPAEHWQYIFAHVQHFQKKDSVWVKRAGQLLVMIISLTPLLEMLTELSWPNALLSAALVGLVVFGFSRKDSQTEHATVELSPTLPEAHDFVRLLRLVGTLSGRGVALLSVLSIVAVGGWMLNYLPAFFLSFFLLLHHRPPTSPTTFAGIPNDTPGKTSAQLELADNLKEWSGKSL